MWAKTREGRPLHCLSPTCVCTSDICSGVLQCCSMAGADRDSSVLHVSVCFCGCAFLPAWQELYGWCTKWELVLDDVWQCPVLLISDFVEPHPQLQQFRGEDGYQIEYGENIVPRLKQQASEWYPSVSEVFFAVKVVVFFSLVNFMFL